MSVFDEVEYGLVVLDMEFQAQFINRAFHQMWALPALFDGTSYNFADIVEHGRRTGAYMTGPASVADYVRQRKCWLRLDDGRVLKFKCKAWPSGGRLIAFSDIAGAFRPPTHSRKL